MVLAQRDERFVFLSSTVRGTLFVFGVTRRGPNCIATQVTRKDELPEVASHVIPHISL
jgi:hypothetical protein